MELWKCGNCGEVWGQDFPYCPQCGDDYLIHGVQCECCEKNFAEEDFCNDCMKALGDAIDDFARYKKIDFETVTKMADKWVTLNW